jgi:hypothetical protein
VKLYFCENCGKRLSEEDIEQGRARDKKLTGAFCKDCATGVQTIETLPLDPKEAQRILSEARRPSKPITRPVSSVVRRSGVSSSGNGRKLALAVAAGVVGMLLVITVALLVGGKKPPTPVEASSEAKPRPPEARQATPPGNTDAMPAPPADRQKPGPEAAKPTPAVDPEERAAQAWEETQKFSGLAPDDKAARIAKIQAFLQEYGQTIVAARARVLLKSLEEPPPRPVETPQPKEPPPKPPVAPPATSGTLTVANAGFEEGGGSPANWDANNRKLQISVDADRPHTGARSLRLHADKSARGNLYQVVKGIQPGLTYEVRAWVRSAGLTNAKSAGNVIDAIFRDESGADMTMFGVQDAQVSSAEWHEVVGRGVAPAKSAGVRVRLFLNDSAGTIWFDDVSIKEIKP